MNPIRYAFLPPSRNVKMSLCHIWLGVARSKKRGFLAGLRLGLRRGFCSSASRCNVRRTVSALTGKNKTRRNH